MKYMLLEDLKMELKAATLRDVEQLHSLELEGFPLDEAATMEGIRMRIEKAGDFFWLGEKHGTTVGFVNGTLTVGDFLSHESMSSHNAAGGESNCTRCIGLFLLLLCYRQRLCASIRYAYERTCSAKAWARHF
uniref:N-acetyltransferase domain-containing protein n=1 Tax=Palpitomonas bilix TaxID=652834 RepID=A0A7S3LUB4_9EUKA|mmetsp:Transcript_46573/g.120177  ORF Transcript_46573/g.120177 Transcript_46573/m.120177 type:complete len:133 (+) Transcript_46573:96-494(+)